MKRSILIVDDEECVTRYLFRTLRSKDYDIEIANNGTDALKILENWHVDLIISDLRMPGMTGYELLTFVKQKYPHIIRIILSGDSERESIIKAVAEGTAKSYFTKPISNDNLKLLIARLFTTYDQLHQPQVAKVVENLESLPVVPSLYEHLLLLIKQNKSMDTIADFISNDPEYAAKMLQIANSSLYGVRIGSVTQALVYLGLETVKQLILGTEIFRSFIQSGTDQAEVELLWKHSRMTNKLVHTIYRKLHNSSVPDEYVCCGLLHDIGMLMIAKNFPVQYIAIRNKVDIDHCILNQAEKNTLGVTHSDIGAYLLDWWNLPQSITETCLYHHDPFHKSVHNVEISAILHISDSYSWKILNKPNHVNLDDRVFELLRVDKNVIEEVVMTSLKDEIHQE